MPKAPVASSTTPPKILFLHGGPGMTAELERRQFGSELPVYWWDQPLIRSQALRPVEVLIDAACLVINRLAEHHQAGIHILLGPPGGAKSHLSSAMGLALLEKGWRVLFSRTSDLVQKLQVARRELALESAIQRLERFDLLILDDITYVSKDQAESSVLFELISARYERRSMLITANQPFGEWGKNFPDPAMTLAEVDRLVHHATIFEMNVESYRRRAAIDRKHGAGRPAHYATPKNTRVRSPPDSTHRGAKLEEPVEAQEH